MALHESLPYSADDQHSDSDRKTRDRFGRYLLFKQLKRDALGETYRAGQIGGEAIERIVSLRLFNAAGIEGKRFFEACQERRELESALSGGPFGEVVDSGIEDGVCFVTHEFVFGRSLAEMLDQARETTCPIPIEHALQIMDRVAMSLHNANGTRLEGQRVHHGFLVPAFVQLSSEGEVRLTGFESTGGILDLATDGAVRTQFAGYTSPEVNQGQPPTGADDVYSMGAIFYELLTSEKLPPITNDGAAQWIEAGVLAEEATPLPMEVRKLLHQSLAARGERIQKAELWHHELTAIAAAGGHSPTTFNLAFFMHTLFGDELDREVRQVEAERQERVEPPTDKGAPAAEASAAPVVQAEPEMASPVAVEAPPEPTPKAAAEEPAAPLDEPSDTALEMDTELVSEPALELDIDLPEAPELLAEPTSRPLTSTAEARTQAAPEADSKKRLFAGIAVLAVAVALALAVFVFDVPIPGMGTDAEPMTVAPAPRLGEETATPSSQLAETPLAIEPSEVTPPLSPEELEEQVRSLVAERADTMEEALKAEYDQRLVKLRRQLEDARQASSGKGEAPPPVREIPAAGEPEPRPQIALRQATTPIDATPLEPPVESELPAAATPQAQASMSPAEPAGAEAEATTPAPLPEAVATQPTAVETSVGEPQTEKPEVVEPGSIVTQGAGVVVPTLVRQPNVVYPPAAVRLKREASVRVRILVDERGRPTEIEQIGPKVGLGFDQAALRAAKSTRWTAPTKDGVPVKVWVELSVDFKP